MRGQLLDRHSRRVAISLSLRRKSEVGSCSMVAGVNAIINLARISGAIFIRLDNSQGFHRHIYSMLQITGKDNKGRGY